MTIPDNTNFTAATDYVNNYELARKYVVTRGNNAIKLRKDMVWKQFDAIGVNLSVCKIYNLTIVEQHDVIEMAFDGKEETIVFKSGTCMMAYILAKYW